MHKRTGTWVFGIPDPVGCRRCWQRLCFINLLIYPFCFSSFYFNLILIIYYYYLITIPFFFFLLILYLYLVTDNVLIEYSRPQTMDPR